jgi:hypothetical protein
MIYNSLKIIQNLLPTKKWTTSKIIIAQKQFIKNHLMVLL